MKKENYEEFLQVYIDEIMHQLDDVKKEAKEQPDNDWWKGFAFGMRTALLTMQMQLVTWHPYLADEEILQRFGINFDADEYIKN